MTSSNPTKVGSFQKENGKKTKDRKLYRSKETG